MRQVTLQATLNPLILAAIIGLTGCTNTLVKDNTHLAATGTSPCSGGEWTDDSSLSSLPIPLVAFIFPHEDLHEIKADNYLKRCGDSTKLINREVTVNRAACVPTALTWIVTLGIWQWCPAHVSWQADVRA